MRPDIRTDPATGLIQPGVPLTLNINLQNQINGTCSSLVGAYVDIWHANWDGIYSDEPTEGTTGQKFLRGYQISDSNGGVQFNTVYPGWYAGRAVHVHFRVRTYQGTITLGSFETQTFFDDNITDAVDETSPYNQHGTRDTRNATDRVFNSAPNTAQNVWNLTKTATGYAGTLTLAVSLPAPPAATNNVSYALPQFAYGGGWYSAIYLSNITNTVVSATVNFLDTTGNPLPVPVTGLTAAATQVISIGANATVELQAPNAGSILQQGWVEMIAPPGVVGYAVLRQSVSGRADQEAVVPLSSETSQAADLVFDNVNSVTGLAVSNPTNQTITVNLAAYDGSGSPLGNTSLSLPSRTQTAVTLSSLTGLAATSGQLGRLVLTSSNGTFSALGLRFGGQAFTSIPVTYR